MATIRQTIIPKAPLGRLMLRAGAQRVSADAVNALEERLSEFAAKLCEHAVTISKHAGRKTVTGGDIKIAARK